MPCEASLKASNNRAEWKRTSSRCVGCGKEGVKTPPVQGPTFNVCCRLIYRYLRGEQFKMTKAVKRGKPALKSNASSRKKRAGKSKAPAANSIWPHTPQQADEAIEKLLALAEIGAPIAECATALGVKEVQINEFLSNRPDAKAAFERGSGLGRVALLRRQYDIAIGKASGRGMSQMLVWLGKQRLGQREPAAPLPEKDKNDEILECLTDLLDESHRKKERDEFAKYYVERKSKYDEPSEK